MEVIYTCDVCGQTFSDKESVKTHMVTEHAQKTISYGEGEEK